MTVLGLVAACSMAIMLIINIKYMETLSLGLRMTTLILLTHLIEIQEESDEEFEIITGFHGDKTIKIVFK